LKYDKEHVRELARGYALLNAVEHGGKAAIGPVMGKIIAKEPVLKKYAKEIVEIVREIVEEVNRLSINEQKELLEENYIWIIDEQKLKRKEFEKKLPPLPNVGESVVTRFAPNPDFIIHLGNARPAILSYEYAKMYKGKMILRFEDTDPRIKKPLPEAYHLIREDLKWLGISWDEEYIQSLRLYIYYDYARKLLEKGGGYIDNNPVEVYRRYRDSGTLERYPPRMRAVEDNLELWDKMLEGHFSEGEAVYRVKTDPNFRDPSVRDWVALRIIDTSKNPHPLVGDKYIVWPTYNFAAAIDDHLMGVTHILRAREHMQNTTKQKFLYEHFKWEYPNVIHFGRLKLEDMVMSKSAIKDLIMKGEAIGLDDPRFATIAGLRRRGVKPQAIRELILEVGIKQSDAKISYVNLASLNKSIIDSQSIRLMATIDPIPLSITNIPWRDRKFKIPLHPSGKLGHRDITVSGPNLKLLVSSSDLELFKSNKLIRLMELFNVEILDVSRDKVEARYHSDELDIARKHGAPIIQWVLPQTSIEIELIYIKGLKFVTKKGAIENYASRLRKDEVIQMIRIGFAKLDQIKKTDEGMLQKYLFLHE